MDQAQARSHFCPVLALPPGPVGLEHLGQPLSRVPGVFLCHCLSCASLSAEGQGWRRSCLTSDSLKWGFTASGWRGWWAESGGKGHQLGLPAQRDRSGGGFGLPCFVTAVPWTVNLYCATFCQLCSSTRKGLVAALPAFPPWRSSPCSAVEMRRNHLSKSSGGGQKLAQGSGLLFPVKKSMELWPASREWGWDKQGGQMTVQLDL